MAKNITSNAVEILRNRYVKNDPKRKAAVATERMNAEIARLLYNMRTEAGLTQEHLAELVGCIGRNALCAVLRIELLQSLVSEVPDLHNSTVACSLTLVNPKMS